MNGAAYYIVAHGHSYIWLVPLLAAAFAASHIAERLYPCYEEWNQSHGDVGTNTLHLFVYEGSNIVGVLLIPLISWLFHLKPGGLMTVWPREWPILAQFVMAIVLADMLFTLIHYVSHRWPPLWRLHAVHHGVPRLYGFNGIVRHPLHQMVDISLGTAPLVVLGMPLPVAVLLGFAISIQLIVQHSNVDYALGPFRNQLAIGRVHHLHHVNWGKEGDCNFGLFFNWWDWLLGTFKPEPPRPIRAHDMGIDDVPAFPKTYGEHLAFPFRYKPGVGLRVTRARVLARSHPAE